MKSEIIKITITTEEGLTHKINLNEADNLRGMKIKTIQIEEVIFKK